MEKPSNLSEVLGILFSDTLKDWFSGVINHVLKEAKRGLDTTFAVIID